MASNCIFCGNQAGSREHLRPRWILARKDFGKFRLKRAGQSEVILSCTELTIETVCKTCNNGWMSKLEAAIKPILIPMLEGKQVTPDSEQRRLLSAWLMKMAFLHDSGKGHGADNVFYKKSDGAAFLASQSIPNFTVIWIGHAVEEHRAFEGSDFTLESQDGEYVGNGSAVTLTNEHFVSQVSTLRLNETPTGPTQLNLEAKYPFLDEMLIRIHPPENDVIERPPKVSFTNGGPRGYANLMDRWRMGKQREKIRKDGGRDEYSLSPE